jgi:hypothetical protein
MLPAQHHSYGGFFEPALVDDSMKFNSLKQSSLRAQKGPVSSQAVAAGKRTRVLQYGLGLIYALLAGLFFSIWPSFLQYAKEGATSLSDGDEYGGVVPDENTDVMTDYVCFFLMVSFGSVTVLMMTMLNLIGVPSLTCTPISWKDYYNKDLAVWHLYAILGALLWSVGTWANLIASDSVGFTVR